MSYPVYSFPDFMSQVDPAHVFAPAVIDLCYRVYLGTFGVNPSFWNNPPLRDNIMGITVGSTQDVTLKLPPSTLQLPTGFTSSQVLWTTPWNVASNGYAAPTDIINKALA